MLNFQCKNIKSQNKLVNLCAQQTLLDSRSNAKCGTIKESVVKESDKVKMMLNKSYK